VSSDAAAPLRWHIHCDGTALPNPGRIGIGVVLQAPDGSIEQISQAAGSGCNNEAEARALIAALQAAQAKGAQQLCVYSDNSVLVEHVSGRAQTRIERLQRLFAEAQSLLAGFAGAELRWIPRHRNSAADALARAALGLPAKPAGRPSSRRRGK
jgi:ribonuclease HI